MTVRIPLLLLLILTALSSVSSSVSERELDAALAALRSRGYTLFGNAVTVSDVCLELLRRPNGSYTFFAPTDATLFALDMASSAVSYVRSLRRHIALRRHPLPALRALPPGTDLPTLLPDRPIRISLRLPGGRITADGIDVVHPNVFHGRDLVAHGLAGIFSSRRAPDVNARINPWSGSSDSAHRPSSSADPPDLAPRSMDPASGPVFAPEAPSAALEESSSSVPSRVPLGGESYGAPSPAPMTDESHGAPLSAPMRDEILGAPLPSEILQTQHWIPAAFGLMSPAAAPSPMGIGASPNSGAGRSTAEAMGYTAAEAEKGFCHVSVGEDAL